MRRVERSFAARLGLFLGAALLSPGLSAAEAKWWNPDFHFRVPVTVDSGMYERKDALAHVEAHFPELFAQLGLGEKAALDRQSVRVIEHDEKGGIVAERASNVLPSAQGEIVVWRLPGKTEVLTQRLFYIYFDTAANGNKEKPNHADAPCTDGNIPGTNLLKNPGFEEQDAQKDWLPAQWTVSPPKGGEDHLA